MLTGENGILTKARKAKEVTEIATYEEELKLIGNGLKAEQVDDNKYLDRYKEEIEKDEMFKNADVEKVDETKLKVTTEEGYIFEITKDNVEYIGKGDKPEEPDEPEIEIPELQEGDITFSYNPSEFTNGSVEVTIETSLELGESWIEYSTNNGTDWTKYETPITVTKNGEIHARISNSAGSSVNTATGNVENIDRLDPKMFTPSATNTTNSITLTGSTEDAEKTETDGCSGIDVYYFSIDGGEWQPENGQAETSYTFSGLVQGKEYTLKMKAVDKAGNETETEEIKCTTGTVPGLVENTNVTFSYSPTTFTRGNVTVTIKTNVSGYTLQYSRNGTSWQNYSSPITMETNGTVYAKLVDSSRQEGGAASANIENIDKLAPNEPTLGVTGVTENSITVTANAEDQAQTSEYASSGIKGYQFSINNGSWQPEIPQTSGTYTFNNLTENTSYSIKVKAIDNANNETEITNAISQTTEKGTIETNKSYVGNYADINGDGTIDGIIYVDLAIGASGQWGTGSGNTYTISKVSSGLKNYYISQTGYKGVSGTKDVISASSESGTNRFYVMALNDAGYNQTRDQALRLEDKQWHIPANSEWAAFGGELGITEYNYYNYSLRTQYWSRTYNSTNHNYYARFDNIGIWHGDVPEKTNVRLCTTF